MEPAAAAAGDEWERRIDDLMERQTHTTDERMRKQLFDEVQQIFAEHLPIVHFVAPKCSSRPRLA
jgi:ABC-type transport system substrate-binding protein